MLSSMFSTQQIEDNLKGQKVPGFKTPVPLSKTCLGLFVSFPGFNFTLTSPFFPI